MTVEKPSLEEALKYIEDFGGINAAMKCYYLTMQLDHKDWNYHNQCVRVYGDCLSQVTESKL